MANNGTSTEARDNEIARALLSVFRGYGWFPFLDDKWEAQDDLRKAWVAVVAKAKELLFPELAKQALSAVEDNKELTRKNAALENRLLERRNTLVAVEVQRNNAKDESARLRAEVADLKKQIERVEFDKRNLADSVNRLAEERDALRKVCADKERPTKGTPVQVLSQVNAEWIRAVVTDEPCLEGYFSWRAIEYRTESTSGSRRLLDEGDTWFRARTEPENAPAISDEELAKILREAVCSHGLRKGFDNLNIGFRKSWNSHSFDRNYWINAARVARKALAGAPATSHRPISGEDIHWVVNTYGEFGVEVHGRYFFYNAGGVMEYTSGDVRARRVHPDELPRVIRPLGFHGGQYTREVVDVADGLESPWLWKPICG